MKNDKTMICPLLSIGKAGRVECLGAQCALWVAHYNQKGEKIGGNCALALIAVDV